MLLTLALATAVQFAPPADTLSGRWRIQGDISGFPLDHVCSFTQTGNVLGGQCGVGAEGTPPTTVTGEVKEDGTITFQHPGEYEGEPLIVIYTGTFSTSTELKGSILVTPFDVTGYFT